MMMAPKLLAAFAGFNPMILVIIAAITALVAAGVWLYKNWDTIKAKAIAIKESVGIPVKYIGLGETKDDLQAFDIEKYIYGLFKDMM